MTLRFDRILTAIWLVIAVATLFFAISVSHAGSVNAPYWDEWLDSYPPDYLGHLFEKHVGHPLVLGRLAFAADYWLFDAQGWALRYAQIVLLVLGAVSIAKLGQLAGLKTIESIVVIFAVAATALLNPQAHENLVWGFQIAFVTAFVSTIAAVTSLAAYAAKPTKLALAMCVIFASIAVLSLGNGVIVPPLLAFMA